ncbi:MAG: hypothetical protein MPW14_24380 [Candidatus Manganitrophus sp.]|nr:MAG: hypothetical protein MPW14_24380 [Candidatus Manganitrophus sp.]
MKPGVLYIKGVGLPDAILDGVAGAPIRNVDMTPYCLGMAFDFNGAPYRITTETPANEEFQNPEFVGGGMIGVARGLFESIGGFDEGIANHLAEVDFCLSAKRKIICRDIFRNVSVFYLKRHSIRFPATRFQTIMKRGSGGSVFSPNGSDSFRKMRTSCTSQKIY